MNEICTVAERYDKALSLARHTDLPADYTVPQPTMAWPPENVDLLAEYREWLISGGASSHTVDLIYIPTAGHVLGLNLKPHTQLNLETDLSPAMDYILAKRMSSHWTKVCRNGLAKFERFLHQKRGELELHAPFPDPDYYPQRYGQGLPDWLLKPLIRYQYLRQSHWRPSRLSQQLRNFWKGHTDVWRWLAEQGAVPKPEALKRAQIDGYINAHLQAGLSVSRINHDLLCFQATLRLLQAEGYLVPPFLLSRLSLKAPDRLPRHPDQ